MQTGKSIADLTDEALARLGEGLHSIDNINRAVEQVAAYYPLTVKRAVRRGIIAAINEDAQRRVNHNG